ncbi:hypothetical protein KLK06_47080 [Nonomuraea sp. NEAU-A123]|nr:hypothetical protein [Nonomuraea sp. NEAU-A123]
MIFRLLIIRRDQTPVIRPLAASWLPQSAYTREALLGLRRRRVLHRQQREAVLTLARQSREKGWWANYQDIWRGSLAGFEAEASLINTYEDLRVPGLFQTEDYATAMFKGGQVLDNDQIRRRAEARLARRHPPSGRSATKPR